MVRPQSQLKVKVDFLEAKLKEHKPMNFEGDDNEMSRAMYTLKQKFTDPSQNKTLAA
jgi:hypothetical protein